MHTVVNMHMQSWANYFYSSIYLFFCRRRNILPEMNDTDLKGCIYNRHTNPYCPIFRLGDIVSEAKENFADMAVEVKPFW